MSVLGRLRNTTYWALDSLRGSPVRKAYDEIKLIDHTDSGDSVIREHQEKQWQELKERAVKTTKFYAPFAGRKFSDFPVISKNDIRSQQNSFMSSDYQQDKLIQMSTSGSTGTPFICYQNGGKKKRVNAEIIYYSEKVGYRLGENLSYIRTVVKQVKKSGLKQFMQNQTLINCSHLSDDGIEKIISQIQRYSQKGPVTLTGYSSTYTAIKDYILKKKIDALQNVRVTGIISGSDMLFDETREVVRRAFGGVPMVSRYSNEENGVLGQDAGGGNNIFIINEADYIVEILDEDGNEVPDGTQGRIVVTDLYNYAMPMIRYDTGDFAAVEVREINGRKKRCLTDFSGRKVDVIFDTEGKALSPYMVTNYMWSFPDVTQFQVIQTGERQYRLKLNVPKTFARESEVVTLMKQLLGHDAQIAVERTDEIPVLASGKRRYIVNEWKRN